MTKYKVKVHELCWYYTTYEVEAESEEEIQELLDSGYCSQLDTDFDTVDQIDIELIEKADD